MSMAVFNDELYQTMVSDDFTVTVPDPIFVGITLEEGDALLFELEARRARLQRQLREALAANPRGLGVFPRAAAGPPAWALCGGPCCGAWA